MIRRAQYFEDFKDTDRITQWHDHNIFVKLKTRMICSFVEQELNEKFKIFFKFFIFIFYLFNFKLFSKACQFLILQTLFIVSNRLQLVLFSRIFFMSFIFRKTKNQIPLFVPQLYVLFSLKVFLQTILSKSFANYCKKLFFPYFYHT